VAHERDHDVEKHLTHILASLSSREEDEDATRRDSPHHGKASPRPARAARVFKNASLGKYCTLGLGGSARVVVEVYTIEQLVSTLRLCASRGVSSVVVGKGSNVLFADAGFDGVAIVNRVAFVEEAADDERQTDASVQTSTSEPTSTRLFRVGSGTPFNALGASLSRRSWSGLEFAAGVPGTAGRRGVHERGRGRARHRERHDRRRAGVAVRSVPRRRRDIVRIRQIRKRRPPTPRRRRTRLKNRFKIDSTIRDSQRRVRVPALAVHGRRATRTTTRRTVFK
jgi:hypothetical protein